MLRHALMIFPAGFLAVLVWTTSTSGQFFFPPAVPASNEQSSSGPNSATAPDKAKRAVDTKLPGQRPIRPDKPVNHQGKASKPARSPAKAGQPGKSLGQPPKPGKLSEE